LDNVWDAGYNATITITNTSDSIIENWCLTFPLNETISDIWNATISETHDDFYVIKNAGWNQDIAVGKSVSFGITVYEAFSEYPEYYSILGNEVETKSEVYTVDYKITEDWGDGYKAAVTITNNKATAIEDWRLTFSYGDNLITQMWNAVILNNTDGTYQLGCETYNQNIAPGESITFGFMVEPGCSGKLMENVVLREYVATGDNAGEDANQDGDKTESVAIIFGTLGEDGSQELYLSMMASVEIKRYEIYMSIDNGNFEMVAETEESEYAYDITSGCSNMEIYAVGYGQNDEAIETNHIFVEKTNGVYAVMLPDTDGDGLEDVYEIYYGSDVNLVDTDRDKLNDYYEVYVSSTYPTLKDSDENGVMDGDEDYDEDGVTILEECENGTDPLNPDSDYDNLVDGDEINVYGTDPLVADCDDDGLVDGDEIAVDTEPLNPDTDGDGILDGDERFQQTYTHQVENEDCAVTEVSVTLEGTGNLQSTTCIESVMNKDALCTGVVGLVGEPFEIETESEFDEATITFKIDAALLGDTKFEDLMFLWYDEEGQEFVELDTILDKENMTVSVVTTHFSKYMVVDKTTWQEAWATELNYKADNGIDTYYTVLTIDCSASMKQTDPIINNSVGSGYDAQYNAKTCNRIEGALEYVDNMGPNDKVAVVLFDDTIYYSLKFTNDKEDIKYALQKIRNYDGTDFKRALDESIGLFDQEILNSDNICTRIVFLSDGEDDYPTDEVNEAALKNIIIYGIGLGTNYNGTVLADMSLNTYGEYFHAESSDMLLKFYEDIYLYGNIDKTDNDHDGLYDIFETAGIRLINGEIIYSDPKLGDTDGDELLDGQEVISEIKTAENCLYYTTSKNNYYLDIVSYPNLEDSDGDGATDDTDYTPMLYNEGRSYIFYSVYETGSLKKEGETRYKIMTNIEGKTVQKMRTTTINNFAEKWAQMGMIGKKIAYRIDEVHMIYHGQPRSMTIDGSRMLFADKIDTSEDYVNEYVAGGNHMIINELQPKSINYLNLSCCNNGNLDFFSSYNIPGIHDNLAISFLKSVHNIKTVSAWDGSSLYSSYEVNIFANSHFFVHEYSTRSESFDKWSMVVNGYVRTPSQKVAYWKDENGNIRYSVERYMSH